jgi:hypothetical protein
METYRQVNEKYALEEALGAPHALVGNNLCKKLRNWKRQYGGDGSTLSVVFEDGTKHKGDFIDAMTRDALPCPIFAKKSDFTALQGADLLAWEVFTHLKRLNIYGIVCAFLSLSLLDESHQTSQHDASHIWSSGIDFAIPALRSVQQPWRLIVPLGFGNQIAQLIVA